MIPAVTIAVSMIVLAIVLLGLGTVLARRVVAYRPPRTIRIVRTVDDLRNGTVTLPKTTETSVPGTYGLWYANNTGHAVIGPVVGQDEHVVIRRILKTHGSTLGPSETGAFGGHMYIDPREFGACKDIVLGTGTNALQLWKITPPTLNEAQIPKTWAIHIHGIRSTRAGVLRSVPAATRAGMPSLVMSFAGEEQSAERPGVNSALGIREWHDIDAVIEYALSAGARSVVLFAWSMGATAALLTVEKSAHRDHVEALVLIDPATDWRRVIRFAATQAKAPATLASLACGILATPGIYRLTGAPVRINFDELDWTARKRLRTPTLVIHSRGDRLVPFELSPAFVAAQEPDVTLSVFDDMPHCAEYNAEPDKFDHIAVKWLGDVIRAASSSPK